MSCTIVSMDFWAAVGLASTIATALATAAATMIAMWWRRLDRTGADWLPFEVHATWHNSPKTGLDVPRCNFKMANTGDGVAYRLTAVGVGCHAQMVEQSSGQAFFGPRRLEVVPAMPPGDTRQMQVVCDPTAWESAVIRMRWVESPTWRGKVQERDILLTSISPQPRAKVSQFDEAAGEHVSVETVEPLGFLMPDSYPPQLPVLRDRALRRLKRRSTPA